MCREVVRADSRAWRAARAARTSDGVVADRRTEEGSLSRRENGVVMAAAVVVKDRGRLLSGMVVVVVVAVAVGAGVMTAPLERDGDIGMREADARWATHRWSRGTKLRGCCAAALGFVDDAPLVLVAVAVVLKELAAPQGCIVTSQPCTVYGMLREARANLQDAAW